MATGTVFVHFSALKYILGIIGMVFPKHSNKDNHSYITTLKVHLKNYESQRQILEAQVIKQNQAKSDVQDLQFQLDYLQRTIDNVTRNQQQSYDNVQQDFDTISSKYIQLQDSVKNLKRVNQELQCSIQRKQIKEFQKIDKLKELEINKAKTVENIYELREKIQNELVIFTILLLLLL